MSCRLHPTVDDRAGERGARGGLAAFGFTERQARFLVKVLLHSGVFVERQYCRFAGIVHGQKTADFLKTLVERRFATPIADRRAASRTDVPRPLQAALGGHRRARQPLSKAGARSAA